MPTTKNLCEALQIDRTWLEQALHKGHLVLTGNVTKGKARDWTLEDAARVLITHRLRQCGIRFAPENPQPITDFPNNPVAQTNAQKSSVAQKSLGSALLRFTFFQHKKRIFLVSGQKWGDQFNLTGKMISRRDLCDVATAGSYDGETSPGEPVFRMFFDADEILNSLTTVFTDFRNGDVESTE